MGKIVEISVGQIIGGVLILSMAISGFFLTSFFTETKALAAQVTTMNTEVAIHKQGLGDIKDKVDYLILKIDNFTNSYKKDETKIADALNTQIIALDIFMKELTKLYSKRR